MQLRPLRHFWFWVLLVGLAAIVVGAIYAANWALGEDTLDHRLAALAAIFGAAAFLLAVVAGLLALLAYNQALALPDLEMQAKLGDGSQGWVCPLTADQSGNFKEIAHANQSVLNITLLVTNRVSARNPAVKITPVKGLVGFQMFTAAWRPGDLGPSGYTTTRWDGGANFLVHGGFPLAVEGFSLGGSRLTANTLTKATIRIEWVADGIQKQSKDYDITLQ